MSRTINMYACIFCLQIILVGMVALPNSNNNNYDYQLSNFKINRFDEHFKSEPLVSPAKPTLILTSVVFRHGHRAPENVTYPNDPYKNQNYFPYNYGELTREGQKTLYKRGQELNKIYESFLGEVYYTHLVESISSSYLRCQMSLQSLHAALFASKTWNPVPGFEWQAAGYSIIPAKEDKLISVHLNCPKIMESFDLPTEDPETLKIFDYIKKHSGLDSVGYRQAYRIYDVTKTTSELGMQIPEWIKPIYPKILRKLAVDGWNIVTRQEQNLRVVTGPLLRLITENSKAKAKCQLKPVQRKMFLYSAHDLNIYFLLQALNVWDDEEVQYGAYILFELHKIDGKFGFKIYLQNNYKQPRLLNIPNCGYFCELEQFEQITKQLYNPEPICL